MNVNDIFKTNKVVLSGEDYFVLSQMYLPLMGITSYTVYLVLNNIIDNETSVRRVLDVIGLSSAKTFEQAMMKLEGIGLVKKFTNKQGNIIYSFLRPASVKGFLSNTLLKDYLQVQIGEVEVNNIIKYSKSEKIKGYEDVTLSFDEVYKTAKDKIKKSKDEEILTHIERDDNNVISDDNIIVKNTNFDYLVFKFSFDEDVLTSEVLNDPDFEKEILKISYQYELNEEEMHEAVIKAMTVNKDLTFEDIARNAGYIYQNKASNSVLGFSVKTPEVYTHELSSDDEMLINIANSSTITQMLASVSGGKGSLIDVRDFTKLQEVTLLPVGVINVLILYLTNLKQDDNLTFTYIEKVARNWMKAGVRTTVDAIKLLNENKNKEPAEKKYKKKAVDEPEWMKREKNNNDKTSKDDTYQVTSELSEEEIKKAQDLAKKILG